MSFGKVIVLNGITSSGKSSLAHALQRLLGEPYLQADADLIKEMTSWMPPAEQGAAFARDLFMPRLYAAIPACFASLAALGNNLIIHDVLRPLQLRLYAEALTGCSALLVAVHCAQSEMERRESQRGNRRIGQAREQLLHGLVHTPGIYDLEVDTTERTAEECAAQIARLLEQGFVPSAFHRIAELPLEDLWQTTDAMDQAIYCAKHPVLPWDS